MSYLLTYKHSNFGQTAAINFSTPKIEMARSKNTNVKASCCDLIRCIFVTVMQMYHSKILLPLRKMRVFWQG